DFCDGSFTEVWVLSLSDPATWTQLFPSGSPPGPWGTAMVFDPARRRLLVLDGQKGQVWALSLSGHLAWTLLSALGTPPTGRDLHSALYDPAGDQVLVFGGGQGFDDPWALSLSDPPTWTKPSASGTAP